MERGKGDCPFLAVVADEAVVQLEGLSNSDFKSSTTLFYFK
jgi:hypothetical protein